MYEGHFSMCYARRRKKAKPDLVGRPSLRDMSNRRQVASKLRLRLSFGCKPSSVGVSVVIDVNLDIGYQPTAGRFLVVLPAYRR